MKDLLTLLSFSVNFWQNSKFGLTSDLFPGFFLCCHSFFFHQLKVTLKHRRFQTIDEIEENAIQNLKIINQTTCIFNIPQAYIRCVGSTSKVLGSVELPHSCKNNKPTHQPMKRILEHVGKSATNGIKLLMGTILKEITQTNLWTKQ